MQSKPAPSINTSTERLVRMLQTGEWGDLAWEEFARRFEGTIMAACFRSEVHNYDDWEDIRQEVLIALRQLIGKFTFMQEKHGFRSWLTEVVKNHIRRHREAAKMHCLGRGGTSGLLWLNQVRGDSTGSGSDRLLESDLRILRDHERLLRAIENCRRRCASVTHETFTRRYLEQESPREIAATRGLSPDTVQRATHRHRERVISEAERLAHESGGRWRRDSAESGSGRG